MLDASVSERIQPQEERANHRPCIRMTAPRWAVLATYPQSEIWAQHNLQQRGYQPYLPLYAVMLRDRSMPSMKHLAIRPLFPGYIFCQHDPRDPWRPIRYCPGIRANLIGGKGIQYTTNAAVEALQATDAQRLLPQPANAAWAPGAAVRLADGPLHGQDAVILSVGHDMALVALMLFGHLREISVALNCLVPRED